MLLLHRGAVRLCPGTDPRKSLGRLSRAGAHGQPQDFSSISLGAVFRDRGGHFLRRLVRVKDIALEGSLL